MATTPASGMAREIEAYFDRLWPICRSIAGPGFRESLEILNEVVPMERHHFKTGEQVLDWEIPKEWVIRDAYIMGPDGKKRAEFKRNNVHLVSHSCPVDRTIPLEELQKNLHSLPDMPKAIPYRTSYYAERWGFCLTHEERALLPKGEYRVFVDSELKKGCVELGEAVLKGSGDEEILFSTYLCHPSLANNELSGPLLTAFLYREIAALKNRRYTYRFLFGPETIGALAYLSKNGERFKKTLVAGYQVTCVGDGGPMTYKESRRGDSIADRAARAVVREYKHRVAPFQPIGSDERQYCSPGYNLPVGSLMRTPYHEYPEYHTSLDNKSVMDFYAMEELVGAYVKIVRLIEGNHVWVNQKPHGEPQLGRRGLYPTIGSPRTQKDRLWSMFWLLNLADGQHDMIEVARISGQPVAELLAVAEDLEKNGLLKRGVR